MVFERSEYGFAASMILTAAIISGSDSVIVLGLATGLVIIALYTLVLRLSTDPETARLWRIIGAIIAFAIAFLIPGVVSIAAILIALATTFFAYREHLARPVYIPIHRT